MHFKHETGKYDWKESKTDSKLENQQDITVFPISDVCDSVSYFNCTNYVTLVLGIHKWFTKGLSVNAHQGIFPKKGSMIKLPLVT